jgi:anti-sigma factor RsiW
MRQDIVSEEELSAFLDGELDAARAEVVGAAIAASPALAERAALYRVDQDLIARAYGPLIDQPVPLRLRRAVEPARRPAVGRQGWGRRGWGRQGWGLTGLALASALALAWGAFPEIAEGPSERLVAEAMAARDGRLVPERQVLAENAAGDAGDSLAQSITGSAVHVPDLGRAGYTLAGSAIFRDRAGGKALELRYRDQAGRVFTIYLHRPTGKDGFSVHQAGSVAVCVWQTDALGVVMLGEMSTRDMLKIASLTYADLDL